MHTPGPWTVGPRGTSVYGPDNLRLARLDAHAKTLGQRADNARLIAAAPDLLAACQSVLGATEGTALKLFRLDNARHLLAAVVAKALGKESACTPTPS